MSLQHLQSIQSFRDVGASINRFAAAKLVKEGRLYLSGQIRDATESDGRLLRESYRLRTFIDTQNTHNLIQAHAGDRDEELEHDGTGFGSVSLLGLTYFWVVFSTWKYAENAIERLPLWTRLKVSALPQCYPIESIREELSESVMRQGHISECIDVLDNSSAEIREVFNNVLGKTKAYPILLHGDNYLRHASLVLLLILLLLGIPIDLINRDYVRSLEEIPTPFAKVEAVAEKETPRQFLADVFRMRMIWAESVKHHLDERHGGVEVYLRNAGVTVEAVAAVREALRGDWSAGARLVAID